MEYTIIIIFVLLYFTSKVTWPFSGKNAHPINFVLFTQIFILTLPGVLILTFFKECAGSITCEIIAENIKINVMLDYFTVLCFILLGVLSSFFLLKGKTDFRPASNAHRRYLNTCFILTLLIFLVKIISVNQVPLFLTLLGHKDAAEIQKAEILRGEDGFSFPVINFLIKYFPLYFYYSTLIGLFKRKVTIVYFVMAFLVTSVTMLYDLQKGPVVIMIIGSFWLYWAYTGKAKMIVVGGIFSLFLVGVLFYISFDFGDDTQYFITAVLNRTFIAQNDGMYWVYQYYNILPNKELYSLWGVPLAQQFGIPQIDPLSDIIGVVFPQAKDSWVNTTTFLLGEAKAIFGDYSSIISSLVVFINVFVVCVLSTLLVRVSKNIFYPAIFVMIQTIPFANNLTDLLYGRFIFGFLVFMLFPVLICFLCYGKLKNDE
ncbi:O71 family O-antigen polymerase [Escherichia coli]